MGERNLQIEFRSDLFGQQQVLTNKDLDLPTQQEMLAQFRCDELAKAVTETFEASVKVVRRPVQSGSVVEGLGALMRDWLTTAMGKSAAISRVPKGDVCLGKFDRDASRYYAAVYQRKRLDLLSASHASLSPLYLGQLKNLHKTISARFLKDLTAGLKEPGYDFADVVQQGTRTAREAFLADADGEADRLSRSELTLRRDEGGGCRLGI